MKELKVEYLIEEGLKPLLLFLFTPPQLQIARLD